MLCYTAPTQENEPDPFSDPSIDAASKFINAIRAEYVKE
jgi:hypothetical protein